MADGVRPRPVGRPVDLRKRAAIVDAAWVLFLARGVEAVSTESIAARAGVSKVTVYRHFPDKNALLEAGVLAEMARIEQAQRGGPPGSGSAAPDTDDVATRLRRFGLAIMGFLAQDNAVAFYNTLAGEIGRSPDLARRFWDAGPGRTRATLAALIADAHARGELVAPDPGEAADHLFGLWQGFTNFQLALGVPHTDARERVVRGVTVFLRAYARPDTDAAPPA